MMDMNNAVHNANSLCEKIEKTKLAEVAQGNVLRHINKAEYYEKLYTQRARRS